MLGWKTLGHEKRLGSFIVNYADDFVICCPRGKADEAMSAMRGMMTKLKLTVNETKTRVCKLPEGTFDFLGYTLGRCWSAKTGKCYYGTRPSKKRITRLCRAISDLTTRALTWLDPGVVIGKLNQMLVGWSNYFRLGPVSRAYRAVDSHVRSRLRQWLRKKHKLKGRATAVFPDEHLHDHLGLVCLQQRTASFPWATA